MRFWLGTHQPSWLARAAVPLFVSHRRLGHRRSLPRARASWALDSGGYSELRLHGQWRTTPRAYVAAVRRYRDEIGNLEWAAVQDWMGEHQARTIASYLELRDLAPDLPWLPIVQGWRGTDYLRHLEAYGRAGIDLSREPLAGVGSVCRRQDTREGLDIFRLVSWLGLRLHGFGVKLGGLMHGARYLASADSMAWSYTARRERWCLPGHTHQNGANCLDFALQWRQRVVGAGA